MKFSSNAHHHKYDELKATLRTTKARKQEMLIKPQIQQEIL